MNEKLEKIQTLIIALLVIALIATFSVDFVLTKKRNIAVAELIKKSAIINVSSVKLEPSNDKLELVEDKTDDEKETKEVENTVESNIKNNTSIEDIYYETNNDIYDSTENNNDSNLDVSDHDDKLPNDNEDNSNDHTENDNDSDKDDENSNEENTDETHDEENENSSESDEDNSVFNTNLNVDHNNE